MKKIAVCLYGNMHSWELCKHNILNFFGKDADYFLYTADRMIENASEFSKESDLWKAKSYPRYDAKMLKNDFNGYKLKRNKILKFDDYCRGLWNTLPNYKVQHFTEQALNVKREYEYENREYYDIVALVRTDMCFFTENGMSVEWNKFDTERQWIMSNGDAQSIFWDKMSKPWDYVVIGTNELIEHMSWALQDQLISDPVNSTYTHVFAEECMDLYMKRYNMEIMHVSRVKELGSNIDFEWHFLPYPNNFTKEFIEKPSFDGFRQFEYIKLKYIFGYDLDD